MYTVKKINAGDVVNTTDGTCRVYRGGFGVFDAEDNLVRSTNEQLEVYQLKKTADAVASWYNLDSLF